MKQPFNDEKLNAGFQIDTSLLTPEQLGHVLNIFQARGMELPINHIPFGGKFFLRYFDNSIGFSIVPYPTSVVPENLPLIDYPTLCRGAVQLEKWDWFDLKGQPISKCKLLGYALNSDLYSDKYTYQHGSGCIAFDGEPRNTPFAKEHLAQLAQALEACETLNNAKPE